MLCVSFLTIVEPIIRGSEKHSSLFYLSVNDKEKSFTTLTLGLVKDGKGERQANRQRHRKRQRKRETDR